MLHFMVGIDYDARSVTLGRYVDRALVETEMFEGFGISLFPPADDSSCVPVVVLAYGSEADEAGIDVGDCLLQIDGVDGAAVPDLDLLLRRAALGKVMEVVLAPAFVECPGPFPYQRCPWRRRHSSTSHGSSVVSLLPITEGERASSRRRVPGLGCGRPASTSWSTACASSTA